MTDFQKTAESMHDLESERIVLGSLLAGTQIFLAIVDSGLDEAHFYHPRHAILFDAILNLRHSGAPVEPGALVGYLADHDLLTKTGGGPYILDCISAVALPANGPWYARRLREMYDRRQMLYALDKVHQAAQSGMDADQLLGTAQTVIKAAAPQYTELGMTHIGADIDAAYADIELRDGVMAGLPTGFRELDDLTGGYRPGQVVVVGARPGMGKTVFGLDAARRLAVSHMVTCAYVTMEMSRMELIERALSAQGSIQYQRIRDGKLSAEDWDIADKLKIKFKQSPLFFDDSVGMTVPKIAAKLRRLKARHNLQFAVVDHVGLVRPHQRAGTRQEEVAATMRDLKELARELDITIMVLAQLHRLKQDRVPELDDLRESGEIEQSADVVIFPYRPDYADPENRPGECELWVKKNRAGAQGCIDVAAQLHYQRMVDFSLPPGVSCP